MLLMNKNKIMQLLGKLKQIWFEGEKKKKTERKGEGERGGVKGRGKKWYVFNK